MQNLKKLSFHNPLVYYFIKTPLGSMIAIADETALCYLAFNHIHEIEKIAVYEKTSIIDSIQKELDNYFESTLEKFTTPYHLIGSPFQQIVWSTLTKISYGSTQSYATIANTINYPSAYRAVARANSTNNLAIIVPCHRVINSNGKIGGYNGGIERKEWLLNHEKKFMD